VVLHGGFVVRLGTRSMDFPSEGPVRHADGIAYTIRADIVDFSFALDNLRHSRVRELEPGFACSRPIRSPIPLLALIGWATPLLIWFFNLHGMRLGPAIPTERWPLRCLVLFGLASLAIPPGRWGRQAG